MVVPSKFQFLVEHLVPYRAEQLPPESDCPICREPYETEASNYELAVQVRNSGCRHVMGAQCLRLWFDQNRNLHDACPMCRAPLFDSTKTLCQGTIQKWVLRRYHPAFSVLGFPAVPLSNADLHLEIECGWMHMHRLQQERKTMATSTMVFKNVVADLTFLIKVERALCSPEVMQLRQRAIASGKLADAYAAADISPTAMEMYARHTELVLRVEDEFNRPEVWHTLRAEAGVFTYRELSPVGPSDGDQPVPRPSFPEHIHLLPNEDYEFPIWTELLAAVCIAMEVEDYLPLSANT